MSRKITIIQGLNLDQLEKNVNNFASGHTVVNVQMTVDNEKMFKYLAVVLYED